MKGGRERETLIEREKKRKKERENERDRDRGKMRNSTIIYHSTLISSLLL